MGVALIVFAGRRAPLPRGLPRRALPLWAAFRFGPREASTLIALLAAIAVGGTVRGLGPFGLVSANEALLLLQAFLATMVVVALPIAALVWEQRHAEVRMRESEERVRLALAATRTGTWEWTVATGEVRWSPSLEAMHGVAPGSFAGTFEAFQADIHPGDRAAVQASISRALEGGEHRVEYRIVRPDGAVRWVEGRGEVFSDADRRPERMIGVCLDVTERKQGEEERARLLEQEQEARRRAEAMERRVGFLGEIARSISSSLDLGTVLQRIAEGAQALCGSDNAVIFLREEHSDVTVPRFRVGPWLDAHDGLRVRPGHGLGGRALLTGPAAAHGQLPRRAQRVGVLLRDRRADGHGDPHGRADHHRERGRGAALRQQPDADAVHGRGREGVRPPGRAGRAGDPATRACSRARRRPAHDAERASRAKDEFLAMLGHELRNPLGAISNAAARACGGRGRSRVAARDARSSSGRSTTSAGSSTTCSTWRGPRAARSSCSARLLDLDEAVARAVAAAAASARSAGRRLVHRGEPAVGPRRRGADRPGVDEPARERREVHARRRDDRGHRAREDGTAVLEVRDSGIGMSPDLLARVFDLFVQGERPLARSAGGLGIGLTLVRRIVELHGGTVDARQRRARAAAAASSSACPPRPRRPPPAERGARARRAARAAACSSSRTTTTPARCCARSCARWATRRTRRRTA